MSKEYYTINWLLDGVLQKSEASYIPIEGVWRVSSLPAIDGATVSFEVEVGEGRIPDLFGYSYTYSQDVTAVTFDFDMDTGEFYVRATTVTTHTLTYGSGSQGVRVNGESVESGFALDNSCVILLYLNPSPQEFKINNGEWLSASDSPIYLTDTDVNIEFGTAGGVPDHSNTPATIFYTNSTAVPSEELNFNGDDFIDLRVRQRAAYNFANCLSIVKDGVEVYRRHVMEVPTVTIAGSTLTIADSDTWATKYKIYVDGADTGVTVNKATSGNTTYDLGNLGHKAAGEYSITVVASNAAGDFLSSPSTAVTWTVTLYDVQVSWQMDNTGIEQETVDWEYDGTTTPELRTIQMDRMVELQYKYYGVWYFLASYTYEVGDGLVANSSTVSYSASSGITVNVEEEQTTPTITFSIVPGMSIGRVYNYTAEQGMTWAEFIESDYNSATSDDDKLKIETGGKPTRRYIAIGSGFYVSTSTSYDDCVYPEDVITADYEYKSLVLIA